MTERCAICGCQLHRTTGTYARPTLEGHSHASRHHYVAERFFGRSTNRGGQREALFRVCPWEQEGKTAVFCYDCHEELLHNPVLLKQDIFGLAELVKRRGLAEDEKSESRDKAARRVELLHEVIVRGLDAMLAEERGG